MKTQGQPPENPCASIAPFADLERMATTLSRSGLMPDALRGKPADTLVVLLTGREIGFEPMQSVRSINVISGKGVLSADGMAALVMRSPQCEYLRMVESTPTRCKYETKRAGHPSPVPMEFSLEDAKRAELCGKGTWQRYPSAMLRARCVAAICRAVYPDLVAGLYDEDEADDLRRRPLHANPPMPVIDVVPVSHESAPDAPQSPEMTESGINLRLNVAQAESLAALDALTHAIKELPQLDRDVIRPEFKSKRTLLVAHERALAEEPSYDEPPREREPGED
jgi:hypothetical protein